MLRAGYELHTVITYMRPARVADIFMTFTPTQTGRNGKIPQNWSPNPHRPGPPAQPPRLRPRRRRLKISLSKRARPSRSSSEGSRPRKRWIRRRPSRVAQEEVDWAGSCCRRRRPHLLVVDKIVGRTIKARMSLTHKGLGMGPKRFCGFVDHQLRRLWCAILPLKRRWHCRVENVLADANLGVGKCIKDMREK